MANFLSSIFGGVKTIPADPEPVKEPLVFPELYPEFKPVNSPATDKGPSAHFSWEETFASGSASAAGLNNDWRFTEYTRAEEFKDRIIFMAGFMETVREIIGQPISINSWYRSPEVNVRIGGARFSTHMQGMAVDFSPSGSLFDICTKLCNELEARGILWDQVIFEEGWIHVSPASGWDASAKKPLGQRCQRMTMRRGGYFMGFQIIP